MTIATSATPTNPTAELGPEEYVVVCLDGCLATVLATTYPHNDEIAQAGDVAELLIRNAQSAINCVDRELGSMPASLARAIWPAIATGTVALANPAGAVRRAEELLALEDQ